MKLSLTHIVASATLLTSVFAQTKLKIMPLGDSITEITCWRTTVWQSLVSQGLANSVDFVGSMSNNPNNCQGSYDMNHEGHSGYQAVDIANNNIAGWVAQNRPDIVNFMLGTNDYNIGKRSTSQILAAYTSIVQKIRAANPRVRIIIDLVIPLGWSNTGISSLNSAIPGWVQSTSTSASPIVIADCFNGFPSNGLRSDSVHPNAVGDAFIASRIGPVLISQIKSALGSTSTTAAATTRTTTAATTLVTTTTSAGVVTTTTSASSGGGGGAPMWGQCGGTGWTGPTTCAQGTCTYSNPWYSQCV